MEYKVKRRRRKQEANISSSNSLNPFHFESDFVPTRRDPLHFL